MTKDNWYFWPSHPYYWCYSFETWYRHCRDCILHTCMGGTTVMSQQYWWHPLVVKIGNTPSQGYCVKISLNLTKQLWRYTTLQPSEGLFPSVASQQLFFDRISSHGSTWPSRSDCCSDSSTHKTPSEPAINLAHDPILSTGTPQSNTMISSYFINQWKVGSPFKIFQAETAPEAGPNAEPNPTQLEYVLNFLGNTGCRKFAHWMPTGTADEISKKKKQASAFMDYLSSTMDHAVSQCCRIY